jgi:hypothetical protein
MVLSSTLELVACSAPGVVYDCSAAAKEFAASLLALHPRLPDLLASIIVKHTEAACGDPQAADFESLRVVAAAYNALAFLAAQSPAAAEQAAASPGLVFAIAACITDGCCDLTHLAVMCLGDVTNALLRLQGTSDPHGAVLFEQWAAICDQQPRMAMPAVATALCICTSNALCRRGRQAMALLFCVLGMARPNEAAEMYTDPAARSNLFDALQWLFDPCPIHDVCPFEGEVGCTVLLSTQLCIVANMCEAAAVACDAPFLRRVMALDIFEVLCKEAELRARSGLKPAMTFNAVCILQATSTACVEPEWRSTVLRAMPGVLHWLEEAARSAGEAANSLEGTASGVACKEHETNRWMAEEVIRRLAPKTAEAEGRGAAVGDASKQRRARTSVGQRRWPAARAPLLAPAAPRPSSSP